MNSIEKLNAYQDARKTVNTIQDELCQMVAAFFGDCAGMWYFHNIDYGNESCTAVSVPKVSGLCVENFIGDYGEYFTFPVPSSIIMKYLDGNNEDAVKEFQQWRNEYWEQKRREEEEAERREEEAIAKASKENEYNLYLKLKDKFEKSTEC